MKTIFIFRQYAYPPTVPGGTRHFNFSKELVERGHRVYIFNTTFHHDMKKDIKTLTHPLWEMENVDGVNFVWLRTLPYRRNNWRRFANALDYSRKAACVSLKLMKSGIKPDVVIGSVAHSFALVAAYAVSRMARCRYIVDVGDLWPDALVEAGSLKEGTLLHAALKKISYFSYRKAEKIFCVTESMKRALVEKGFREGKVLVTPPGIVFHPETMPQNSRVENGKKDFLVVYAGSFNPLYPVENVVRAADLLKKNGYGNIRFLLIGDGEGKPFAAELKKELHLENVELLNPVPKKDMPSYYEKADAFIVIEKKVSFGFPNKLIDYLMWGKPVILASPNDYTVEKFACARKADPENPEDIMRCVLDFFSLSDDEHTRVRDAAVRYLTQYHDIKSIVDIMEKAFSDV